MKKYEEPTMKLHQLKANSIMAASIQEQTRTISATEQESDQDAPATQGFTSRNAW